MKHRFLDDGILNILMVCQIFERPEDNGSDRHYYFCNNWAKEGHKVTVLTANVDYKKAKKRFETKGIVRKKINGVNLIYVPVFANFRGSIFKRFIFFISFVFSVSFYLLKEAKKSDLIYGVSTPLTVPLLCSFVSKLKKLPFVFEVTDVWPDAAIHTNVIKNKYLIKLAFYVEQLCYAAASHIVCLTNGIKEILLHEKKVSPEKLSVVTNGVDTKLFSKVDQRVSKKLKCDLGLKDHFVVMYLGAHGKYNSLVTVVDAANEIKRESSIKFFLIGDGDEKANLRALASKKKLNNVMFYDSVARKDAVRLLSIADCFLLPNLKGEFFKCNLPNKFFDYLASAAPIVVCGEVEAANIVRQSSIGRVVEAENPVSLSKAILEIKEKEVCDRKLMGSKARELVFKEFDRSEHAAYLLQLFYNCFQTRGN